MKTWLARRMKETGEAFTRERWLFAADLTRNELSRTAVALYVLYRAVNHFRHHGPAGPEHVRQHMDQLLHEATRGSGALRLACEDPSTTRGTKRRR